MSEQEKQETLRELLAKWRKCCAFCKGCAKDAAPIVKRAERMVEEWRSRTNNTAGNYRDGFADALNECADEFEREVLGRKD